MTDLSETAREARNEPGVLLQGAVGHGQAEPTAKLYLAASASCTNLIFFLALNFSAVLSMEMVGT